MGAAGIGLAALAWFALFQRSSMPPDPMRRAEELPQSLRFCLYQLRLSSDPVRLEKFLQMSEGEVVRTWPKPNPWWGMKSLMGESDVWPHDFSPMEGQCELKGELDSLFTGIRNMDCVELISYLSLHRVMNDRPVDLETLVRRYQGWHECGNGPRPPLPPRLEGQQLE